MGWINLSFIVWAREARRSNGPGVTTTARGQLWRLAVEAMGLELVTAMVPGAVLETSVTKMMKWMRQLSTVC